MFSTVLFFAVPKATYFIQFVLNVHFSINPYWPLHYELEIYHKKKSGNTNTWKLNNILLNNDWVNKTSNTK